MNRAICTAAAFLLIACGGDTIAGTVNTDPLVGTYTLQTVGGHTLPATVSQSATYLKTVTQGSLELTSQSSFSLRFTERIVDHGVETSREDLVTGDWSKLGATFVALTNVQINGGSTTGFTATIAGSTLTWTGTLFTEEGGDFIFAKAN